MDSYRNPADGSGSDRNLVTFVCINRALALGGEIGLIGSFASLIEPTPLRQVEDSDFWAVSFAVPRGEVHFYKFVTGSRVFVDPINPQQVRRADGSVWSRFFTEYCTTYVVLERWESRLLERLTNHILPFRTTEGQRWLDYYYESLSRDERTAQFAKAYRLDQPIGAASFIDKLLARQEQHRLVDYRICLELCYQVLQRMAPGQDPLELPPERYGDLYGLMANDKLGVIAGWDYARYASPRFFLQLLRRHTFTGAFAHPRHGGNVGGAGWQYLAGNLLDPQTGKLPRQHAATAPAPYFDWAHAQEPPLGRNSEYNG